MNNSINNKICFLIPSLSSGGIEIYLFRFLQFLGFHEGITVIVRNKEHGELFGLYCQTKVKLVFMPLGYLNLRRIFRYHRFFMKERFDVICDFNANFAGIPIAIAKIIGINKRIAFYRQGSDHFSPNRVRDLWNRFMNLMVYRNATHILFNSYAAKDYFFPYRKTYDGRFQVIYNGVDSSVFHIREQKYEVRQMLGLPLDKFIVGHIGRFDKTKNHETILKVVQMLIMIDSGFHFLFCGKNTEKLFASLQELGLQENVTILGYRSDIPLILKSIDLFFFPSITEGQPNALIEAGLSGVPIIASNIKPVKEVVPESFHNFLRDPYDSEGFASLILEIKQKRLKQKTKELRDWMIREFNAGRNFKKFREVVFS